MLDGIIRLAMLGVLLCQSVKVMAKRAVSATVAILLALPIFAFADEKQEPSLPNYTKAPFHHVQTLTAKDAPQTDSDPTTMEVYTDYADDADPEVKTFEDIARKHGSLNIVGVVYNGKKEILSAQWVLFTLSSGQPPKLVKTWRKYGYANGKFSDKPVTTRVLNEE